LWRNGQGAHLDLGNRDQVVERFDVGTMKSLRI
jgi:hypothetical protein